MGKVSDGNIYFSHISQAFWVPTSMPDFPFTTMIAAPAQNTIYLEENYMKVYTTDKIRNVVLLGHGGTASPTKSK